MDSETRYLLDYMRQACLTGANFIEFYHKRPEELRAWAARIESAVAPNSVSLAALNLRSAAIHTTYS